MRKILKTPKPTAAKLARAGTHKVARSHANNAAKTPARLLPDSRPPAVVKLGRLSRATIRRAVSAALEGKTFEADA